MLGFRWRSPRQLDSAWVRELLMDIYIEGSPQIQVRIGSAWLLPEGDRHRRVALVARDFISGAELYTDGMRIVWTRDEGGEHLDIWSVEGLCVYSTRKERQGSGWSPQVRSTSIPSLLHSRLCRIREGIRSARHEVAAERLRARLAPYPALQTLERRLAAASQKCGL